MGFEVGYEQWGRNQRQIMPGPGKPFQRGNTLGKGGVRLGSGRNVELNVEQQAEVKKLWPEIVVNAFRKFHAWLCFPIPKEQMLLMPAVERQLDDSWRVIDKHIKSQPDPLQLPEGPTHINLSKTVIVIQQKYENSAIQPSIATPSAMKVIETPSSTAPSKLNSSEPAKSLTTTEQSTSPDSRSISPSEPLMGSVKPKESQS